jgi:class 3 adenylate cyclase
LAEIGRPEGHHLTAERVERRLAAVLAADVAGYSRLMGGNEEGTLARLKAVRKALVDPTIAKHRGRIVKTTGDGMLVEFASAVDAVHGAVEIQRGMAEQNASVPQDQRIEFRIGIHVGDIIIDDNDIFGDGVNVAARLEGIAEAGGVCISDDAQRQIRGKVAIAFEDMGSQTLKNIAEPMRAWRMRLGEVQTPTNEKYSSAGSGAAPALPDKPSIAVLPFQNMSGDPEQEYFTDGMVEDIITALSRFKSLFVIARNSSFTYKGKAVDRSAVNSVCVTCLKAVSERLAARSVSPASSSMQLPEHIYGLIGLTVLWMTSLSCRTRSHPASSRQSRRALNRPKSIGRSANRLKASTPLTCTTALSNLFGALPAKEMKKLCGLLGNRFRSIPVLQQRMA